MSRKTWVILQRISESETSLFTFLFVFRSLNAFLVQTYFVADEYWQSLEVAHRTAFGYGYLTWEWQYALRSALHPLLFAAIYQVLRLLGMDHGLLIIKLPMIFQAALQSYSEVVLFRIVRKLMRTNQRLQPSDASGKDKEEVELEVKRGANCVLALSVLSWFHFFCSTRTLINSLEMQLAVLAFDACPAFLFNRASEAAGSSRFKRVLASKKQGNSASSASSTLVLSSRSIAMQSEAETRGDLSSFVVLCGLLFSLRPTSAIYLVPLVLRFVFQLDAHRIVPVCIRSGLQGIAVIGLCTALDCVFYGRFELVQLNFARFNVLYDVGTQYGVHPYYWYLTAGLPTVLGPYLPLFLLGLLTRLRAWLSPEKVTNKDHEEVNSAENEATSAVRYRGAKQIDTSSNKSTICDQGVQRCHAFQVGSDEKFLLFFICWTVYCLSFLGHKEFRFIYCLLPACLYFVSMGALKLYERPLGKYFVMTVVLLNLPVGLYTTLLHQRGTVQVSHFLRRRASMVQLPSQRELVTFLMPCHSTPFYSHLHVNMTMRFLTCEPILNLVESSYATDASSLVTDQVQADAKESIALSREVESTFTADHFYENPTTWLNTQYCNANVTFSSKPLHLALFDSLLTQNDGMQSTLTTCGYEQCSRIWHAHFPVSSRHGRYVLVYCLTNSRKTQ